MATFNVRIFGHRGVTRLQTDQGQQGGLDSALVLQQPYLWQQTLTVTSGGATAVSSTVAAIPTGLTIDPTAMLHVEVPDGFIVGYEVNEGTRSTAASANSPRLSVAGNIQFGPGWTLSVIDMTGIS